MMQIVYMVMCRTSPLAVFRTKGGADAFVKERLQQDGAEAWMYSVKGYEVYD